MDKKLLISIIIPVYNTEKYLEDCINSLLNQGLNSYEIIIVDDGSTDNSYGIINNYSQNYKFIKYLYQDNSGQGAARNLALKEAQGEYIYLMDSDDYLDDGTLSELMDIIISKDLDILLFDGKTFIENENESLIKYTERYNFNYIRNRSYGNFKFGEDLMCEQLSNNDFYVSPCLYIFKKSLIIENDLEFMEGIIHEDELFTVKLLMSSKRSKHINKAFFNRRVRVGSTMTGSTEQKKFSANYKILLEFNEIVDNYQFRSINNKKIFINKKIKGIYISVNNYLKKNPNNSLNIELNEIYNKYKKYGLSWYIYSNFDKIYKYLRRIKNLK